MKKFTAKAYVYSILTTIGLIFAIYSINIKNYALSIIAILFAAVSAYNIFCNVKNHRHRPVA